MVCQGHGKEFPSAENEAVKGHQDVRPSATLRKNLPLIAIFFQRTEAIFEIKRAGVLPDHFLIEFFDRFVRHVPLAPQAYHKALKLLVKCGSDKSSSRGACCMAAEI